MAATLDQSFYTGLNNTAQLRTATSTNFNLAQSFVPSVTGVIVEVHIDQRETNSPSGNVWVSIYTDSSGSPGVSLGKSNNVNCSTLTTSHTETTFSGLLVPATSGITYWIVEDGDYTLSDTVWVQWGSNSSGGYASGSAKTFNGSTWSAFGTDDFLFKEYYDPTVLLATKNYLKQYRRTRFPGSITGI